MEFEPSDLWQYIPLSQFSPPVETAPEAVRTSLRSLLDRLRHIQPEPQIRPENQQELRSLPQRLLDWAASTPEWDKLGSHGLEQTLTHWLATDHSMAGVRTIIHAPGSTTRRTVVRWALEQQWRVIEPPSVTQVLGGDAEWLQALQFDHEVRWVLPDLEKFYLRQYNGLILLRRLLDRLWSEQPPLLIVCSSWAWTYLSRVLHINSLFPEPITLAPFDVPVLSRWFRTLSGHAFGPSFAFRDAATGEAIFLPPQKEAEPATNHVSQGTSAGDESRYSNYLETLAVHSRGNPGVAWAIWRESLHITREEMDGEAYQQWTAGPAAKDAAEVEETVTEQAKEAARADQGFTIWVRPWQDLALPQLPAFSERREAFVLHTLLLHNGLPSWVLAELLPVPDSDIANALQRMHATGLLEKQDNNCWRVTTLGYPAVRAFLRREGFLVDDL